ncbi:sulfotransferase 6B1-like [Haliotis cracherodii]|uniref:sulfotransferase 6B1-like n=1 Tax=Haliotis cracherodii TaxID=6455 RepID=UPI0039ED73FB
MSLRTLLDCKGNPYTLLDVDGTYFPDSFNGETVKNITNVNIRDDDVLVCGHARSGTHLTFELIHMLIRRKAELSPHEKETQTLELQPEEVLSCLPSPRILNTHVQYHLLPTQVQKKKTKIIYLMRDPRDVIVSRFVVTNQYRANERTMVEFDEYLVASVEGKVAWGSWFDDVISWEKVMSESDHPVLIVRYEETKQNPFRVIKSISEFLNIKCPDQLVRDIAIQSDFKHMKTAKGDIAEKRDGEAIHYRKGITGDWKNWFTAVQTKDFNDIYTQKMKHSKFYDLYL